MVAAALSHDIGNPIFWAFGKKAIGEYFKTGNGLQYKDQLTGKQWQDLIDFEGNVIFSVLASLVKESKAVCVFRMLL